MRDRPEFDSEHPDPVPLTPEEQTAFDEGMRRRRVLQAAEDDLPEIGPHS